MASILVELFEHNRWANLRATVPGTAGSVRDTLMHIAGAEQRYVLRLSGRRPTYGERDGWPGADALAGRAGPDEVLEGECQGRPHALTMATVCVQAINHATEHRSRIATIMTQQGDEPPDFSGWAWGR